MLVFFEKQKDLEVMAEMVNAYEQKRVAEGRTDDDITGNIIASIVNEIKLQRYTSAGYQTKHIRCHECKNVWLAIYNDGNKFIKCLTCGNKIPILAQSKNKEQ